MADGVSAVTIALSSTYARFDFVTHGPTHDARAPGERSDSVWIAIFAEFIIERRGSCGMKHLRAIATATVGAYALGLFAPMSPDNTSGAAHRTAVVALPARPDLPDNDSPSPSSDPAALTIRGGPTVTLARTAGVSVNLIDL